MSLECIFNRRLRNIHLVLLVADAHRADGFKEPSKTTPLFYLLDFLISAGLSSFAFVPSRVVR